MFRGIDFPRWRFAWPFYSAQQALICCAVAGTAVALIVLFLSEWATQPGYRFMFAYWGWIIGVVVMSWFVFAAHILGVVRLGRVNHSFEELRELALSFGYNGIAQLAPDRYRLYRDPPAGFLKLNPAHDYIDVAMLADEIVINGPLYVLRAVRDLDSR